METETDTATDGLAADPTSPFVLSPDFYRDPQGAYGALRARGPVNRVVFPDGSTGWLITGHAEAKAAFGHPGISKRLGSAGARAALEANNAGHQLQAGPFEHMLVFYDPPEHTRLRSLLTKAFSTRAVRGLAPRVTELADYLLGEIATLGEVVDLLDSYAVPLSMSVICELLGVPDTDRARFQSWSTVIVSSEHAARDRMTAAAEFVAYIDHLIAARTTEPGPDLLSELIAAGADDERLTPRELRSMVLVLLVAGFETTANLIGNAAVILLSNNDTRQQMRSDATRIPAFIEEVLRFRSPTSETTFRYTTTPITLGGIEIAAGDLIVVSVAGAGRDSRRFADPHQFDIDRPNNTEHLAFGHGIHFCVGAPLARMQGCIGLTQLLARYPDLALADEPTWRTSFAIRGLTALPVRLRP
ncbi:cytochrome P450 family protein [Nocardia brasiliensis]|uniref:cytochrome P450 family protein n=1 Tax=Nocardia brasiliensis TaxID=37326 RepID=UPI0018947418|nr:cytochrome P450 [Nocardia brasiliensis]MBF6541487.1 cytochrome P450 [Nocardia brasiliensis]